MLPVPLDGLGEALAEVGVDGPPAELPLQLGGVDRVAAVVAGAVAHPVEVVLGAAHLAQYLAQDLDVGALAVGADEVGLADPAPGEDVPDGAGVVLGVDPVADVLARAVELRADPAEDVGHLPGDELLDVLVGAVVVRAVGDRGPEAVGPRPGAHEQVRGRLGRGVGGARAVGVVGLEAPRLAQREVAVDLVGAHVVVADSVLGRGLDEAVGADDVGAHEGLGVGDRVVVVGLGRVVHDGVVARDEALQQALVAHVAHDELHLVLGEPRDVLGVAGVGELVEDRDVDLGVVGRHPAHEVAADEAAAAGHDDVVGLEDVLCHAASPPLSRPDQRRRASGASRTRSFHIARRHRPAVPCQSNRSRTQSLLARKLAGPVPARQT